MALVFNPLRPTVARSTGDRAGAGVSCGAGDCGCPVDLSRGAVRGLQLLSLDMQQLKFRPRFFNRFLTQDGAATVNPPGLGTDASGDAGHAGANIAFEPMAYLVVDSGLRECRVVMYLNPGDCCGEEQIVLKQVSRQEGASCPAFPGSEWMTAPGFEEYSISVDENGLTTVALPDGGRWIFDPRGMPTSRVFPGGQSSIAYNYTNDLLSSIQYVVSNVVEEEITITHTLVGSQPRIQYATVSGGARRLSFEYYLAGATYGAEGDLQRLTLQQEISPDNWSEVSTECFRYHTAAGAGGYVRGLRSFVGPAAYRALQADGHDPLTVDDPTLAKYADQTLEYDAEQRVTKAITNGGSQAYNITYTTNAAQSVNSWSLQAVMATPLGSSKIVLSNYHGQDLLIDHKGDVTGALRAIHHVVYTDRQQMSEIYTPTSINMVGTPYTANADGTLTVQKRTGSGIIRRRTYYPDTDLEKGRLAGEWIQKGTTGVPLPLRSYGYTTGGANGVLVLSQLDEYPEVDPADGAVKVTNTTQFAYQFHATTDQISQRVTKLPPILTGQNDYPALNTDFNGTVFDTNDANESNTRQEVFDVHGRRTDVFDALGVRTGYTYFGSGAIQSITEDLGGPLERTTTFTVDRLGRQVQSLGPPHDINGQSVQRVRWTAYRDAERQVHTAEGYRVGGTDTLINPVRVQKLGADGTLMDAIQVVKPDTNGPLTGAEDFSDQSLWTGWTHHEYAKTGDLFTGERTSTRVYHLIPTSGAGVVGTNYSETAYGYDVMGRPSRRVAPEGTIWASTFDYRDQLIRLSIGTNDAVGTSNMVPVSEFEYDYGTKGGNGILTYETHYVDASTTRQTQHLYDWRDRRHQTNGELDYLVERVFDHLDRPLKEIRRDTSIDGTVLHTTVESYDSRGRVYRTVRWDGVEGLATSLTDNTWLNPLDRVVKHQAAGTQEFQKTVYDRLMRATNTYLGFYNSGSGSDQPDSLTNNLLLEQVNRTFDAADNLTIESRLLAYHNNVSMGALVAGTSARPDHTAFWYDAIGRQTAAGRYGNQGADAAALARPSSAPVSSSSVLVSTNFYDSAGRLTQTTSPAEPTVREDRTEYDHADRITRTIQNYKTGSSTNPDEDVITDFTHTADGQISTVTARNSLTGDQMTRYVYGTDLAATPVVHRNDLLRAEIYPDSDDTTSLGNGADGVFDRVEYMQNRQGEVIQKKNQNGSVHAYDYDLLGRLEHDRVLTVGVGVDNAVRRISISYTKLGRPFQITSYSSATVGAGTVLNQIERTYFGFGQLLNEYQALTGAKDGTTPWVAYGYDSTARGLRPLSVRYPNGRQAYTTYGATGSVADKINRIDAVYDDNGGVPASALAQYTYLGRGTIVAVNSPTPTLTLDLIGSGTAYAGFDRFLRVVDQRWKGSSGADLDRYQHGYDQASNRTFRDNLTTSLQDEYYTYDGLQRLKNFDRGDLNAGRTGITGTPVREEDWTLDRTGNWPGYVVKASGTTSLNQTRGHNPANEVTLLTATVGTVWAAAAHDRNGNMTSLPKPASLGTALTCKYDAWNRLVEIKEGTTVLGAYKYDGLMRRIEKVAGGSTTRYYHSNQWQVLEERVDSTTLPRAQYVWGPRYVDDLIVRDRDSSAPFDGVLNERLYYLQDANWNVTALVSASGVVQERYAYEPYGGPLVFNGSWGSISASAFANSFTYTGRQLDSESGIYQYRYRYYHAQLGRFVGRDPREIASEFYMYAYSRPIARLDPYGLDPVIIPAPEWWPKPYEGPRRPYPGRLKEGELLEILKEWDSWAKSFQFNLARLRERLEKCCDLQSESDAKCTKSKCLEEVGEIILQLDQAHGAIITAGGPVLWHPWITFGGFGFGKVCHECEAEAAAAFHRSFGSDPTGPAAHGCCFHYRERNLEGAEFDHVWGQLSGPNNCEVITIDFWHNPTNFWALGVDPHRYKPTY
ncbi:MAG: RHS repeat-associated core domain-containing protein [Pirellulales bacterium]